MAFTLITVTGQFFEPDGVTPQTGYVDFQLSTALQDSATDKIIPVATHTAHLDASGVFSIVLVATNDPTNTPLGATYVVTEHVGAGRSYSIEVPYNTAGATIYLGRVAPVSNTTVLYPGPTGPVGMFWRGAWSALTTYAPRDGVQSGGSAYIALATNTNSVPPSADWSLVAQKGDTGATGATGAQGAQGIQGATGPTPSGTPNKVLATDASGGATSPAALRALAVADIPALPYDPTGTAAGLIATHEAGADPHSGYALESALGDAALLDVGTGPGTVAAGNDSRIVQARPVSRHSGLYYPPDNAAVTTTSVLALNQGKAMPFYAPRSITLDRIGCEVTTLAASSTVRLGIYADNGAGYPGSLVLNAGTVDASSAAQKEIAISQILAPGLYWLVAVAQGGTPTLRAFSTGSPPLGQPSPGATVTNGYLQTGISGVLPNTWSTTITITSTGIIVWVRVA